MTAQAHDPYLLTPKSRVLLEKRTASQLVKKFHAFCGARMFITALTYTLLITELKSSSRQFKALLIIYLILLSHSLKMASSKSKHVVVFC